MTDNDRDIACANAREALDAYRNARCTASAPDEDITDLMVGLLHLLDSYESLPAAHIVLGLVQHHYEEEADA